MVHKRAFMRSAWGRYGESYIWPLSAFAIVAEKLSFESISFSRRCKRASFESTNGIKAGDGDEIITSRLDIAKIPVSKRYNVFVNKVFTE